MTLDYENTTSRVTRGAPFSQVQWECHTKYDMRRPLVRVIILLVHHCGVLNKNKVYFL